MVVVDVHVPCGGRGSLVSGVVCGTEACRVAL
jgi:hypothetical protein